MGGSAIGVDLRPLGKGKPAAPRGEVFDATRALLVKTWKAKGVFGDRDKQDLTQPADQVSFWFYDSVDWPIALAEHWLRFAMIEIRKDWERDLATRGYAIKGKYLGKSDDRFFLDGDRIGHPDDEGVFWQLPEYDYTEYEELDAKTMKLVEACKTKKACACPWCAKKK